MGNSGPEPLLQTKIMRPVLPGVMVSRPGLTRRLQIGYANHKLSLISAPAGFGKTTLILDWLNQPDVTNRVSWFSIDASDNEPSRFWTYLLKAIEIGLNLPDQHLLHL